MPSHNVLEYYYSRHMEYTALLPRHCRSHGVRVRIFFSRTSGSRAKEVANSCGVLRTSFIFRHNNL